MSSPSSGDAPIGDPRAHPEFERVFNDCLEELNTTGFVDPDQIARDHPDFGAAILEDLELYIGLRPSQTHAGLAPLGTLGDYTLRRQIGRGGMGVVYEACQGSMDRVVALKVLPPGVAADNKALYRFMREAKTAGQLKHQNIVGVHSTGVEEGTPWYSMEYVEGETLGQILAKIKEAEPETETPFGPKDGVDYFGKLARAFADVADGLQHAHSKGVVHRDIKPSNLILDEEGRLRILDFGLARLEGQESLTLSGDFLGTPAYMSPEQAKRRKIPVDHKTDIYSLGATLYELLTHQQPFRGKDHQDTLSQIIERDPRPPRQLNPRVPADLETIVLKCLRKDAADRYGTAEALGQDLRRFVRGDPVEAQVQSLWEKTARRFWRQRRLAVALVSVMMATLIGSLVANVLIEQAREDATNARDQAQYDLYASNMRLAMEVWNHGNLIRFRELLDTHVPAEDEPDLRGWEWHYLDTLRDGAELTLRGHADSVRAVAWSSDGRLLASRGVDGRVLIWTGVSGERVTELESTDRITAFAWSPNGERIASGSHDGTLTLWELSIGHEPVSVGQHAPDAEVVVQSVAWHPDRGWIAAAGADGRVSVWDVERGSLVNNLPILDTKTVSLAWSHDGQKLAAACRSTAVIIVWSTETWKELCRAKEEKSYVTSVSWSPDSTRLATGDGRHNILLFDARTGEKLDSFSAHLGVAPSVAWSPDGDRIASAGTDNMVRVQPVEGGEAMLLRGHVDWVWSVAWSPDGTKVASASEDGTVKVWRPPASAQQALAPGGQYPAVWSDDGRWLAAQDAASGTVRILDAETGELTHTVPSGDTDGSTLAFSRVGQRLAWSDQKETWVWDWEKKHELRRFRGRFLAWSPEGHRLAIGKSGRVFIWELQGAEPLAKLLATGHAGAWSPDGRLLATTSGDQVVRVWETETWAEKHEFKRQESSYQKWNTFQTALAWSPDSRRLLSGGAKGDISVWDVATGERVVNVRAHGSHVKSVAWSPDGERFATGGTDMVVKIWDAKTAKELLALRGHRFSVWSLAWHPDSRRLVSADPLTDSVRIWDASKAYAARTDSQ